MTQRTFIMIKPDAVCRQHIGDLIQKFESNALQVIGLRMEQMALEKAEQLYSIHKGKPFYDELIKYATSDPVVLMVLQGEGAVSKVRRIIGATDPSKAEPGTVRALYGVSITCNTVHAADSPENAEREILIFFDSSQLVEYELGKYKKQQ